MFFWWKECNDALKNYKPKNLTEELIMELLLIPKEADDEIFGSITKKICNSGLSDKEIEVMKRRKYNERKHRKNGSNPRG